MRVAFAGTPEFARICLQSVFEAGHTVCAVLTQPDRPSGRGMKLTPSPVKVWAQSQSLSVLQPSGLRLDGRYAEEAQATQAELTRLAPEVLIVVAYGLILPQWVLALPQFGCLNVHASLLPRWRGAAPIQRAVEAGDAHTGVCIMQMDEGLDTGPVIAQAETQISEQDTSGVLFERLAHMGSRALCEVLAQVPTGTRWPAQEQDHSRASYAKKIEKAEALLDPRAPAAELERRIRAFDPAPGCRMQLPAPWGEIKVWRAQVLPTDSADPPGSLLRADPLGLDVQTGAGILRILEAQRPGGRRQAVAAWF